jgi:hypothetical protein
MQIKSIFIFLTVCAVLAQFNYMMTQDVRPDGCILAPSSGFFHWRGFSACAESVAEEGPGLRHGTVLYSGVRRDAF